MTRVGTWVPPGPSRKAGARPLMRRDRAGNCWRIAARSSMAAPFDLVACLSRDEEWVRQERQTVDGAWPTGYDEPAFASPATTLPCLPAIDPTEASREGT